MTVDGFNLTGRNRILATVPPLPPMDAEIIVQFCVVFRVQQCNLNLDRILTLRAFFPGGFRMLDAELGFAVSFRLSCLRFRFLQ